MPGIQIKKCAQFVPSRQERNFADIVTVPRSEGYICDGTTFLHIKRELLGTNGNWSNTVNTSFS